MEKEISITRKGAILTAIFSVFFCLYYMSRYNYLLFHSLVEFFSITVACGIFMVAWNSRRFMKNNYLLFLGIAYLFIGGIDLVHTLAYKGMGVMKGYGPNLPTQLWIAARYMESISLVLAPLFLHKDIKITTIITGYIITIFFLFMTIFIWAIFPDCFIEGEGLTIFKKASEYVISLILIGAIIFLYKEKDEFEPSVLKLLITSIMLTVGAELAFTFYVSVYGLSNFIGHIFKFISFYLIYKAVIETGLMKPYDLLFRNLKLSEEELRRDRDQLRNAFDEIKTLKGLFPICSMCKKIRDDEGYWDQIEIYIEKHSDAEFSHSICPDCAREHYSDYDIYEDK